MDIFQLRRLRDKTMIPKILYNLRLQTTFNFRNFFLFFDEDILKVNLKTKKIK